MDLRSPTFDGAACRGMDVDQFFEGAENPAVRKELKKMCNSCPILDECQTWALKHEPFGYWGGLSADERRRVRKECNIHIVYVTPDRLGVAP